MIEPQKPPILYSYTDIVDVDDFGKVTLDEMGLGDLSIEIRTPDYYKT